MAEHPFWELVRKNEKSDTDKVAIVGVAYASQQPKYSMKTQEEIYDALLKDASIFSL